MALMAWKKRKELSSKILDQNGGKYHKKKKQGSHVAHGREEDYQETKKFHVVSNKDQFKTDLPPELVFYATTQFKKYIPERSIHDAICEVHPVSNNLNQVKKMDELLNDPFQKKKK